MNACAILLFVSVNYGENMYNKVEKGKKTLKPLSYEQVYQLINQQKWSEIIRLAYDYSKIISSDEMLDNAFKIFESEFFRNNENLKAFKEISQLYLMHTLKAFQLQPDNFKKICVALTEISFNKGEIETAYNYARQFPEEEICAKAIKKYKDSLPKVVEHSQSKKIRVTENRDVSPSSYVISLFKSNQEHDFFMAVREVFPMYTVYPNVAISSLIDFEKISPSLSYDEKEYFFKSIVDCVVFDHHKNYIPINFFELDSPFHDNEIQKKKDELKDKIFALAGLKLYRIRKLSQSQGKVEFLELIREVFDQ